MTSDTDTDTRDTWMTYAEAAKRLGISPNAIKQRVKRGKMQAATGNDGHPRVWLPTRVADTDTKIQTRTTPTSPTPEAEARQTAGAAGPISLDDVRAMLGEQSERLERQHRETVGLLVERIDAAEVRAERAEEKLVEVLDRLSRPWWSRLFGASKRSDIKGDRAPGGGVNSSDRAGCHRL